MFDGPRFTDVNCLLAVLASDGSCGTALAVAEVPQAQPGAMNDTTPCRLGGLIVQDYPCLSRQGASSDGRCGVPPKAGAGDVGRASAGRAMAVVV